MFRENDVNFFTLNQWFDDTFFNENALQNLHFPSIDFDNLKKFEKKYLDTFQRRNLVRFLYWLTMHWD